MNKERMRAALEGFRDAGIPVREAAIVVAISTNESNNTFGIPRDPTLVYPYPCMTSRQVLRLERGRSKLTTAMLNDPEIMSWLKKEDMLDNSGTAIKKPIYNYDSIDEPAQKLARYFEFLLDQRKSSALRAFSVGPTQMFLDYSPALGGSMVSRFTTYEELYNFYMARDARELWGHWFSYLPADDAAYPTTSSRVAGASGPNDAVETYLQRHQTGAVDWSDPTWTQYANGFYWSVQTTWSLIKEIGYK